MNWNQIKDYWKTIQNKLQLQRDRISNAEIMQIGCDGNEPIRKFPKNYENHKNSLEHRLNKFIEIVRDKLTKSTKECPRSNQ